ncbi:MAG: hypothetical protein ISR84_04570, partial [Kiritimatiellales bacterium]|nr:hypothetical protein [Kiritimatiellales bacterium]
MSEPSKEQKSKFDELVEQIEATLKDANETKAAAQQTTTEANQAKAEATTTLQQTKKVLDDVNAL